MILTLECPDIKEPAIFTDWFSKSDVLQFEKDVRADFSIPAFVAFKTRCIVNSLTTYLVTKPENFEFVRQTGQIPVASLKKRGCLLNRNLPNRVRMIIKLRLWDMLRRQCLYWKRNRFEGEHIWL